MAKPDLFAGTKNTPPLAPTVFDPTKYDVLLNEQGYRIQALSMDNAPHYAPRFNTGEQGENDLDMLRTGGNTSFTRGMFQEKLEERDMVTTIIGGYVNPDNDRLYPTPQHQTMSTTFTAQDECTASTIYAGDTYYSIRNNDTNTLWKITEAEVVTEITLPAELLNAGPITQLYWPRSTALDVMLIFTGNVGRDGVVIHHYNGTTVTALSGLASHGATLRDNVFVINDHNNVYIWDADSSNWIAVINALAPVDTGTNLPNNFVEFNHRIWLGSPTGMYSFDGVTGAKFIEGNSQYTDNCKYMAQLQGWLYFNMDGYIWRHNSVTVERLKDFRDTNILGISTGGDRVYIITNGGPGNSVITKDGWDVDDANIWCFDAVGWFLYNNTQTGNGDIDHVQFFNDKLYTHFKGIQGVSNGTMDVIDFTQEWQPGPKETCIIYSSEMDMGFPNVPKYLESIEVDFEDLELGDEISVGIRTRNDTGSWTNFDYSVNPISISSPNTKRFFLAEANIFQYQIIINKDNDSFLSIESAYTHYAVQPDRRKRWNVALICQGVDEYNPEKLKDRSHETATAKQLRDNVYLAHRRNLPSLFLTPDYCTLAQDIDDVEIGNFEILGTTNTFNNVGSIYIGTEIMHYSSKTETSFNVIARGVWNTTAEAHVTGDVTSEMHRVFVENIINENFILHESSSNDYRPENDYGIETVIQCQITEVNTEHEDA